MEIEEKDKETFSDKPYCSHQQQISDEKDDVTQEEKQPVDKMTLLHQALSQASVTRAKRCKQILILKQQYYWSSIIFVLEI
ncbi:unnamed protein product [Acanthocheilonema viteae]|uniref:Uncharacterized protein n=1 Tax=Acanthocheilonema viteae TaxID=6277 RepID=A0A498T164_ACAVI|nr:unnamed protein product [Acanthocheilonema viteae]